MDCCVIPLEDSGFSLVQTIDYFYPSVEDPYANGQIACANVLSDLYAMGITKCDNMLMVLAVAREMTPDEREKVVPQLMRGLNDHAIKAGTRIRGGQTILNPWPIIGGVATACVHREQIVMPDNGEAGDVLVLTKPLGTQVAVNAHQWLDRGEEGMKLLGGTSVESVKKLYFRALDSMSHLNKTASSLMLKYECHGCTDVTGFGIKGHANNLARVQKKSLELRIHTLPVIRNATAIVEKSGKFQTLLQGTSAETSGGLLMMLKPDKAKQFIDELKQLEGRESWIIGEVISAEERKAVLVDGIKIQEVPSVEEENYLW
ncbi:selenide, water dikinase-like isoform X1 [Varroa jacobsoni]|uniref:selenide, water dikinase-like isoform X1 n=1 Tax=Varroa jacobsoni TaxID=62625 RepID=UPI000BF7EBB6|nr:selenide, water dikinase-like isoform X1 [Varroa jacobsoni]XP_022705098.1 selenide, water dikinase-like isoform X1 [Varroa jacobsoni]XP_022705099.1 selenide, water dikinase-like isoform X1 [Varroa jacobsoni]